MDTMQLSDLPGEGSQIMVRTPRWWWEQLDDGEDS